MTSNDTAATKSTETRSESDNADKANAQGPRTGRCAKCSRLLPLFAFEIVTSSFHAIESRTVWLCVRDWSEAKGMDERDADAEDWDYWLPRRREGWNEFAAASTTIVTAVSR